MGRIRTSNRMFTAVCLSLGAAASVWSHAAAIEPGDWAQYNYDNRGWRFNHAEQTLKASNVATLEEKWRFPTRGSTEEIGVVHATPVVVNGYVYFGTTRTQPSFYKLTPDGKLCWCHEIESIVTAEHGDPYIEHGLDATVDGVMNSALVDDQRVYFGTFGGQLICLDRFSGKLLWKVNTKREPFSAAHPSNTIMSSPILADGKLIVAGGGFEHALGAIPDYPCCSGRGFVAAFDPESGESLWGYTVGPEPERFDPLVAIEFDNGNRIDRAGGEILYQTPKYQGPPVADMRASKDTRILALPSALGGLQTGCGFDGERVYANGTDWPGLAIALQGAASSRTNPIIPPSAGRVTAIAPNTLVEHWRHERPRLHHTNLDDGEKFTCGDPVGSGVALTDELVFFTTTLSGELTALDSRTGKLLKTIPIGPVWCGPSVSNGRVYVGSGSDLFTAWSSKEQAKARVGFSLPTTEIGAVYCFGLPDDDGAQFSQQENCPQRKTD